MSLTRNSFDLQMFYKINNLYCNDSFSCTYVDHCCYSYFSLAQTKKNEARLIFISI